MFICSKSFVTFALVVASTLLPDDKVALYPAPVAEKGWGFIDHQGKMVIEPQFTDAGGFKEGLAAVATGRVWGYIDATGKVVIEQKYRDAQPFSEGLAAVLLKPTPDQILANPWGFIDKTGKMVIEPNYESPSPFSDGFAYVVFENRGIFIDKTGKPLALPEKAKAAGSFHDGLAPIRRGSDVGYIDTAGKLIVEPRSGLSSDGFSEGVISLTTITGEFPHKVHSFVYIDKTGATIVTPKIDGKDVGEHHEYSDGLAWMHLRNDRYAFLDKTGAVIFQLDIPGVVQVGDFHDGRALIQVGGGPSGGEAKFGYIDKTGKVVIEANYDAASDFVDGLAHVQRVNDKKMAYDVGYIDVNGKVIWGLTP